MSIRIRAARSLAYAPHYAALLRGSFADAGVDVSVDEERPGHSAIAETVVGGEADLVLGSLVFADRLARAIDSEIVAVSNQRSRHMIFARREDGDDLRPFDWGSTLLGRVVVVAPTFVPTSWVAFIEVLHRHGVSLDRVKFLVGYTPQAVVEEFLDGQGDVLLAGGEECQDARLVELATLAEGYGPVPWSVYCATTEWGGAHRDELRAFRRGLGDAQRWINEAAPEDVASVLAPEFPGTAPGELASSIAQYQRIRFWAPSPSVVPADVQRWARALADAGVIDTDERILRTIPSEEVQ